MSNELKPEIIPLEIAGRQYTLHLYKDKGKVIYYRCWRGQEEIISDGRPQKIGDFEPEKTETEEELIKRLTELFTEIHRREAEAEQCHAAKD